MNQIYKNMLGAAVVTAVASLSILGCGDSDGGEASAPLTKAQFLNQADQICRKRLKEKDEVVKAAVKEVADSGKQETSKQLQNEVGESILSTYRHIASEIDALEPPSQDEDDVEEFVGMLEDGLDEADADPSGILRTDTFGEAAEAGRDYGLKACNL